MLDHNAIKKGDRVHHRLFGTGTVTDTLPIGDDTVVTIAFDSGRTRKLCAVISALEYEDNDRDKKQKRDTADDKKSS